MSGTDVFYALEAIDRLDDTLELLGGFLPFREQLATVRVELAAIEAISYKRRREEWAAQALADDNKFRAEQAAAKAERTQ